jgi:hypothetical protein
MSLNNIFKEYILKHKKITLKNIKCDKLNKFNYINRVNNITRNTKIYKQFNILYKMFVLNLKIKSAIIIQRAYRKYFFYNYYYEPCCICFGYIKNNDIYISDCASKVNHIFHYNCLVNYSIDLNNIIYCPICRVSLLYTNINKYTTSLYNDLYNIEKYFYRLLTFVNYFRTRQEYSYIKKYIFLSIDVLFNIYINTEYIYQIKIYEFFKNYSK